MTTTDEDPRLAELTEKEILFEIWSEVRTFRRLITFLVFTSVVLTVAAVAAAVASR